MRRYALFCLLMLGCLTPRISLAVEPALEFLQGLRERRYYDSALQYLEQIQTRKDLPPEVQQVLPYERGETLLQSAKELTNLDAQRQQLDAAQAAFEEFVKAQPNHPLGGRANTARGQILLEKARVDIWDGDKPSNEGNRAKFRDGARQAIASARKIFEQARDQHKATWEKFPTYIPEDQKVERAARDEAEELYIRAQLDIAQCTYWEAQTYDKTSKERKDLLVKSAEEFEKIHTRYRSQIGGLYARIWQGKCFEEQGGAEGIRIALGIYEEILGHDGTTAAMRSLKDRALRFRLICLNYPERHDYQLVVQEAEAWLKDARDRARTDVGLGIQWELCRAQEALGGDRNAKETDRKNNLTQALNRARTISRYPGELKTPASAMIQRLMVALNRDPGDPKDFETAYGNGGQLFEEALGINATLAKLQSEGKQKEAVAQYETLKASAAEMARMYDLALRLANANSDQTMVNIARLRLSYGYLLQQRFYEAAVVADDLVTRFGEKFPEVAREAGFLAMTAFDHAYTQAKEDEREFEAGKVIEAANKICDRWPDSDRANDARNAVAKIYWNAGNLIEAANWWNKIPKGTAQYADAQVRAGKAYWRQYVLQAAKPEGERASVEDLNKWKQAAIDHLTTGLNEAEKNIPKDAPMSDDLVGAKLTLVNIRNLDGMYQAKDKGPPGALDLLTKEPHPVLKAVDVPPGQPRPKDPAKAKSRQMASFAYQQLLRAWVGLKNLDEARKARQKLEEVASGEDEAALTQVFVDFGRELQQELERLKAAKDQKRLDDVRTGFESFLNDLFERKDGQTFYSLLWIAETYTSLADSAGDSPEKANDFYNKASTAYQSIVEKASQDPNFCSPPQLLACKLRLVNCLRSQGDFPKAEAVVQDIIKASPNAPDAQFEAARLYQAWGAKGEGNSAEKFAVALYGKKEPVHIWGWTYTAQSLQRALYQKPDERLEKLHFDARYDLAAAEQQYGLSLSDPKKSVEHLERAKAAITGFQRVSKRWDDGEYERFNTLYKTVLANLGQPVLDLPRELADSERKTQVAEAGETAAPQQAQTAAAPQAAPQTPAQQPAAKSNSLLMILVLLLGGGAVGGMYYMSILQSKKKQARYATAGSGSSAKAKVVASQAAESVPLFEGLPGTATQTKPARPAAKPTAAPVIQTKPAAVKPQGAAKPKPAAPAQPGAPAKPVSKPKASGEGKPAAPRPPRPKPPENP